MMSRLFKKAFTTPTIMGGLLVAIVLILSICCGLNTFADDGNHENYFVTIHDQYKKLTVKTNASTVGELIERTGVVLSDADTTEPALDEKITENNFNINIYRAYPAVVTDGNIRRYLLTSSYDSKIIAQSAGFSVYDGDTIEVIPNEQFLEIGDAVIYRLKHNGGTTVTVETTIPYSEETVADATLSTGQSEVRQFGEDGRKAAVYQVHFIDGVEVSRELISETIIKEPVSRITAVGAKKSIPPEWDTCAGWARQAGVSEADLQTALTLIYHESGCRYDATNASSGAYGIPQALPGNKMANMGADWETNPITQIRWMINYVNNRYGGWSQAMDWWWEHHWY